LKHLKLINTFANFFKNQQRQYGRLFKLCQSICGSYPSFNFSSPYIYISLCCLVYERDLFFRKAQENTLRILLETKNPNIIVTFEEGSNFTDILLVIENIGGGVAYDTKIKIDPPFNVLVNVFNKYVNESGAIKNGIAVLKNGSKHEIYAASTIEITDKLKDDSIPKNYTFTVNYSKLSGEVFTQTYDDSLEKFLTRLDPKSKPEAKEFKFLKSIDENFKKLISLFDDRLIK